MANRMAASKVNSRISFIGFLHFAAYGQFDTPGAVMSCTVFIRNAISNKNTNADGRVIRDVGSCALATIGNRARQIVGRIPCRGMAGDTPSESFDSTSLPAARLRGATQDDRDLN